LAVICALSLPCFLHLYRAHRDLHSFPTRRSSDLLGSSGAAVPFALPVPVDGAQRSFPHGRPLQSVRLLRGAARRILRTGPARRGDRKSTRLNSSHVKISYAVFCLKKKRR